MFSDIVQRFDSTLNALYQERDARRANGRKVVDLVSGNVNTAGFIFPPAILKQALAIGAKQAQIYTPDPLGQKVAREAVSTFYRTEGLTLPASQICLTAGTSLSYAYLFKLLANPGDEILCPKPSYPLLDSIAELSGITLTGYRLREGARWTIDLDDLQAQITAKTRAIVLISPHNPTGAVATEDEIAGLAAIAKAHRLPIISDEVFSPFVFQSKRLPRPATHEAPLVLTLNGLSKLLALPGLKIGWIGVTGDLALVKKTMYVLDRISDTFLPVNEVMQFALPVLLKKGKPFLKRYVKAIQSRAEGVMQVLKNGGLSFIPAEGGFYLTIPIPKDEEETALTLLTQEGLLLHPGYFYDLEDSHLVMSFVSPQKTLTAALHPLITHTR